MVQELYRHGTVSVPPWKIVFRCRSGFAGNLGCVFIVWFFDAFLQGGWRKNAYRNGMKAVCLIKQ